MEKNNKTKYIIIGVIIAIAIVAILLIAIGIGASFIVGVANKEKDSITATEYKSQMEAKNYYIYDATNQFNEMDYIQKVYLATDSEYKYQIEFYEISDETNAVEFYNYNKSIFESSKGNSSGETDFNGKNYNKYTSTTNGKYRFISRINNTVIYVNCDVQYKDTVKDILNELGY